MSNWTEMGYTPSTNEVRESYVSNCAEFAVNGLPIEEYEAQFDRWLEAHEAAIQRVRDLHKPCDNCDYHVFDHCVSCCRLWPCPTIKALDGEQG